MSAWNTDSGVAIHAELVGREWIKQGHELTVFSFLKEDFHGNGITRGDENYVIRCFGTSLRTGHLDPRPILARDYDVFVVQDLRMLPVENLAKIFPALRRKAGAVIHVLHECELPSEPWFYQFDWDAVVYFDPRQSFISKVYKESCYIPFPCAPLRKGSKQAARRRLGLPLDKNVILIFAQRGYAPYLPELPDEIRDKTLLLILAGKGGPEMVEDYSKSPNVEVRKEPVLSWEKLDEYAFASDAIVLHKFKSRGHAVVSSTIFQLLGTGRPFLIPRRSDFFHPLKNEVLKYSDYIELGNIVREVIAGSPKVEEALKAASLFVKNNSAEKIAAQYIEFFKRLLGK